MKYASKVQKKPQISPMYEEDKQKKHNLRLDATTLEPFTINHKIILALFAAAIFLIIFGATKKGWYIHEIAALFFGLGILTGFAGRLKLGEFTSSFIDGAKGMVHVALVVAFARAILVVAADGNILDSMLNYASKLVSGSHPVIASQAMLIVQTFINFFVPSGSGQAALTMPIMTPLADVIGVSRQIAVLAFQFGDGYNLILPTSGATMGVLAMAGVSYQKWLKWIFPLMLIWFVLSMLLLVPPYFIGWQ
jgi:uncharacterized ion transporter superfamily protein YfcC